MLAERDREEGRTRRRDERLCEVLGVEEVPQLWPDLEVVRSWGLRLGRDESGRSLVTERVAALAEAGVVDRGERDAWHVLWDALDRVLRRATAAAIERIRSRGGAEG